MDNVPVDFALPLKLTMTLAIFMVTQLTCWKTRDSWLSEAAGENAGVLSRRKQRIVSLDSVHRSRKTLAEQGPAGWGLSSPVSYRILDSTACSTCCIVHCEL